MMLRITTTMIAAMVLLCGVSQELLAVDPAGPTYAWGSNSFGEIGDDSTTTRYYPVNTDDATEVTAVFAGDGFSLALNPDGTLWAWGYNGDGELGDGTTTTRLTPVHVLNSAGTANLDDIVAADGAMEHAIAVDSSGNVWAWGHNTSGQLGDGTTTTRTLPVQVKDSAGTGTLSDITAVSCNHLTSLALDENGNVWSWGGYALGRTGTYNLPGKVKESLGGDDLDDVVAIACGHFHHLVIKSDGTVWAWGANGSGQLGDDTTTIRTYPVQVLDPFGNAGLNNIVAVSAGYEHSLALDGNGNVWAWGKGSYGRLGNNSTADRDLPVRVAGTSGGYLTNIVMISAGYDFSMAMDADGNVYAWGRDSSGALGVGGTGSSNVPVQVMGVGGTGYLTGITCIAAGSYHALACSALEVSGEWEDGWDSSDGDWVYENYSTATQGRHQITFTCDVDVDPNSNSTYTVMTSDITHNGTANDFTVSVSGMDVTITGGQRGTATPGTYTLQIPVQGDDDGGIGIVTATFTLRTLGDINTDGLVNYYDFWIMPDAFSGHYYGIPQRAFDADGNGYLEPADTSLIGYLVYGS